MRACVFGSSSKKTPKAYTDVSYQLGSLLAKKGHVCVTGGGLFGCMGAVADGAADGKGKVEGVIHEMWCSDDNGEMDQKYKRMDKLIKVGGKNLMNRKARLIEDVDCFIALPGGLGTGDELWEVMTERQLNMNPRPIVILNVDGYYDGLLQQLRRSIEDGIMWIALDDLLFVTSDPEAAVEYCEKTVKNKQQKVSVPATEEDLKQTSSNVPADK
mmetsp:Transcript_9257/g.16939  ORF Transcript_9257/g.16939 Transcript_9257/m.16939 type:complete len:214 (-) Transcript_9257:107-748(-)